MNKAFYGDYIFENIGAQGPYQIILSLLLIIVGGCSESVFIYLPFQETPPIVSFNDSNGNIIEKSLDYEVCKLKFDINYTKSIDTWLLLYGSEIYCSKLKVTMLAIVLCLGGLSAALLVRISRVIGNRFSIIMFSSLITISTTLIYFKNYWLFLLCHYFYGISGVSVFLLRNTIISEHTSKKYRSYFMYSQIIASLIGSCIFYYLFEKRINWRYVYGGMAIVNFVFVILFYFYSVENPRFYLVNLDEYKIKCIHSIRYIGKINRKIKEDVEEVIVNIFNENNYIVTEDIVREDISNESEANKVTSITRHFLETDLIRKPI